MSFQTFYRFARTLTVRDICDPVICFVDHEELVDELHTHWAQETLIPQEQYEHPHATVVIVLNDEDQIVGWYDFRAYWDERGDEGINMEGASRRPIPIKVVTKPFPSAPFITADTPLLNAIRRLSDTSINALLVHEGERPIGLLQPQHLYAMEGRLCLFGLILGVEAMMLSVLQHRAEAFATVLQTQFPRLYARLAKKVVKQQRYIPFERAVLSLTSLSEKIQLLTADGYILHDVPGWEDISNQMREVRNKIAHQHDDDELAEVLHPSEVFTFVQHLMYVLDQLSTLSNISFLSEWEDDDRVPTDIIVEMLPA